MSKPKAKAPAKAEEIKAPEAKPTVLRKAFTVERVAGGWSFVTLTYESDDGMGEVFGSVVAVERSEPDLKTIILEKFKIAVARYWGIIG